MTPLRVLVVGGGVAALETVLGLLALAREHVDVELLAPAGDYVERPSSVRSPFTGVLPPSVPFDRLNELGVTLRRGSLASVDPGAHSVRTTGGGTLGYDRLVVATGARAVDGVPGAITFHGPISAGTVEHAVRDAQSRVLFVVPPGTGWPLPLYELALMAAANYPALDVTVVTPEPRPLDVFGSVASDALARLLDRAGIVFTGDTSATEAFEQALVTDTGELLPADAVITLAQLVARPIEGLPANEDGFVDIDDHARVRGVPDVFAAGDMTSEPIKQGGLATQQADAAAELIAAEAGAPVDPRPLTRILRGAVLTGEAPLYLRRDLDGDASIALPVAGASRAGLWWPEGKVAGRYLSGFVAAQGEPGDRLSDRPPRRPA